MVAMTPKFIRSTVDSAWYALERACYATLGSSDIDRLLRESLDAERGHRRFMRHGPHPGYRVSAETAAKLIALQQVLSELRSRKMPDLMACSGVRKDCVTAWGIAWSLKQSRKRQPGKVDLRKLRKALEPVAAFDYAEHCAR